MIKTSQICEHSILHWPSPFLFQRNAQGIFSAIHRFYTAASAGAFKQLMLHKPSSMSRVLIFRYFSNSFHQLNVTVGYTERKLRFLRYQLGLVCLFQVDKPIQIPLNPLALLGALCYVVRAHVPQPVFNLHSSQWRSLTTVALNCCNIITTTQGNSQNAQNACNKQTHATKKQRNKQYKSHEILIYLGCLSPLKIHGLNTSLQHLDATTFT